jgi:hypothetical protein
MRNGSHQSSQAPSDLVKLQFDFAWKWFSFHADQRVKMFNFMLIVFGIFATAVITSIDKHLPRFVSIALCIIAAILALIFTRLDRRNRDLVWLGEDVLVQLERTNLFREFETINNRENKVICFGVLWRQAREERARGVSWWRDAWLGKHRIWLRCVGYLFSVLFVLAAIWIWINGDQNIPPNDSIHELGGIMIRPPTRCA